MQDWFREHQILKKVLVVQLPRHLEFLEMLILLEENSIIHVTARHPQMRQMPAERSSCHPLTRVSRKPLMVRAA